jgi:hypothetical protein
MDSGDKKLRHDIRGTFHALLLSTEVLRGALPPEDRDLFLNQILETCDKLDHLMGQVQHDDESVEI